MTREEQITEYLKKTKSAITYSPSFTEKEKEAYYQGILVGKLSGAHWADRNPSPNSWSPSEVALLLEWERKLPQYGLNWYIGRKIITTSAELMKAFRKKKTYENRN